MTFETIEPLTVLSGSRRVRSERPAACIFSQDADSPTSGESPSELQTSFTLKSYFSLRDKLLTWQAFGDHIEGGGDRYNIRFGKGLSRYWELNLWAADKTDGSYVFARFGDSKTLLVTL